MASQDDFLTTQKNGVQSLNAIVQYLRILAGPETISPTVPATTSQLIVTGTGRIYSVSIPAASGAHHVYVYDSATVAGISASNLIWSSYAANAANFSNYNTVALTYSRGIVVVTETSMNACVGYTQIT